jgi:hypothetical protein
MNTGDVINITGENIEGGGYLEAENWPATPAWTVEGGCPYVA